MQLASDPQIHAFPPIIGNDPKILILGTMPGAKSLEAQEYYAHPQNHFWRIMGDLYGAGRDLPYERRIYILRQKGVAVWDVVARCQREGSLDSAIRNAEVNNFKLLFNTYPSIEKVVFDSLKAEQLYKRYAEKTIDKTLIYLRVPSPSPAHASLRYEQKLTLWRNALEPR